MTILRTGVLEMGRPSLHGRRFGLGHKGELIGNGLEITRPCVDASITVGDEDTDVREITIQLKDIDGNDINYREMVEIFLLLDADGDAFVVTGGSTGIAIGTDGALLALVAKKVFLAISESDGDIDLTWTDTGTEAAYLCLRLPNGRIIVSDALTNTN